MLKVEKIKFSYRKNLILENIDFEVKNGELVSILGLNGSGKTTLLKLLAKIENPDAGIVFVDKKNIEDFSRKELAQNIGYLPQKYSGEFVTVFDAILLGRKVYMNFSPSPKDIETVNKILDFFHLKHLAARYTNELSGGELQKVLIARAIAQEPKILLLDEPINHLDIYNQLEVMGIIKNIVNSLNIIAIIVMHDINIALKFSDKFILLKDKQIYNYGDKNIITQKALKDIYNVNVTIKEIKGSKFIIPN